MTIYFLNLPASQSIVRRYMCTSFPAGGFLFPPHDLIALAGVAKAAGHNVVFTDAIGEGLNDELVKKLITDTNPDLIISLISFELYDEDVNSVKQIKKTFPGIKYGLFGHYPTHFAEETLKYSEADFIILGEPDHIFERLLVEWREPELPKTILGTVIRIADGTLVKNEEDRRVPNPNLLPIPAYELLKSDLYKEHFMDSPIGLIQTARGCPYKCNYCVHSFGTKLTVLSPENVVEQIMFLQENNHIKALRFIDDTFTAIPSRVIKICKLMIEYKIDLPWTCLSRADTLDPEMLYWMKKAGCIRLNIGIESGSQRVLDILNKGLNVKEAERNLQMAKKAGLELMGFFLTGIPGETDKDINEGISLAKKAFDYVVIDTLKIYPGTALFETMGHLVKFSLMPYQNYFIDSTHNTKAEKNRSRIYREFYLSFNFIAKAPKLNLLRLQHLRGTVPYVLKLALNLGQN